jgi:hypothetical protein
MIPRTSLTLPDSSVPAEHTGWTPGKGEYDEEGFGGFRGTWIIRRVGMREARAIISVEAELIDVADRFSGDAEEFEAICKALENCDSAELPEKLQTPAAPDELSPHLADSRPTATVRACSL